MPDCDHAAPITWEDAFAQEQAAVLGPGEDASRLEALCVSGGGIRSAAYCLGVLQALAQAGQLSRFHYLSTVSGGGYIGAWLQTLIGRVGVSGAERRLGGPEAAAPELRRLRRYTNWITPKVGALSLDTWTGVAIYLRNVLLNWLVYAPMFLLGALAAVFMRTVFYLLQDARLPGGHVLGGVLLAAATAGLLLAAAGGTHSIPSRRPRDNGEIDYLSERGALLTLLAPSLAWAFLVPPGIAPFWIWMHDGGLATRLALPALFMATCILGYVLAALMAPRPGPDQPAASYWPNLPAWCGASLAGAATIWAGLEIARRLSLDVSPELMAVAGPGWLLLSYAAMSAVHAGLRIAPPRLGPDENRDLGDLDSEWMARLTAQRLRAGVLWALFAFGALTLSRTLVFNATVYPAWVGVLVAGPLAAWVGKQAYTQVDALISGKPGLLKWELVLQVLSAVFAAAVLAGAGFVVQRALGPIQAMIANRFGWGFTVQMTLAHIILALGLAAVLGFAARHIQVNRFSMHGSYRNRLVRAFLGPARPEPEDAGAPAAGLRQPDPLTDFDPADNPALQTLRPDRRGGPRDAVARRLFPVIGATLNLTSTERTDWAERKAAPFTLTPLHCGAAHLRDGAGAYLATAAYRGTSRRGISLGTAMTVSGAAVSPSWGYHSSRLTAFVMTLFNVRLGAWLPNPAAPPGPKERPGADALRLAWDELQGCSDDKRAFVYLSDGGHFDNLGLYEMLRRRCRLVVVVDAAQDGKGQFHDLGGALRKARIDLGAKVEFTFGEAGRAGRPGLGVGKITYCNGAPGLLLLLKPLVTPDAPADVLAYRSADPAFPHESTGEQWFTEAQFESYRALGEFQAASLLDNCTLRLLARRSGRLAQPHGALHEQALEPRHPVHAGDAEVA